MNTLSRRLHIYLHSGRFWLKVTACAGILVLLSAALQIWIHYKFDEQAIRSNLAISLQDLHRQVHVNGQIVLKAFPSPGLSISDVVITEPNLATPFAKIGKISLSFSWWAFLFGRHEIKSLFIDRAQATIIRGKNGPLSITDLLLHRRNQHSFSLNLDNIDIQNSTLTLVDERSKATGQLTQIRLNVTNLNSNALLQLTSNVKQGSHHAKLTLNTPLIVQNNQIRMEKMVINAKSQLAGLDEAILTLTGQCQLNFATLQTIGTAIALRLTRTWPMTDIQLRIPRVDATLYELTMPGGILQASMQEASSRHQLFATFNKVKLNSQGLAAEHIHGNFDWYSGNTKVNVKLNAPLTLSATQVLTLNPIYLTSTMTTPLLPRGRLTSTLKGSLNGTLSNAAFRLQVAGQLDDSHMTLLLNQYSFFKPRHEAILTINRLDLNRYLPETKSNSVSIFQHTNPIPLDWLNAFDLSGKVSIGELAIGQLKIKNISSNLHINPREIELDQMSGDIYSGHLQGNIVLSRNNGISRLRVKQTLQGMEICPLLIDLFDFNRLTGKGNGTINIVADGQSFAHLRSTLSGLVRLSLNQGALTGIDLVSALKNLPAELKEWNSVAKPDQKTTFSTLSSSFRLDKGVARSQDLKLISEFVNVQGAGKLDMVNNIVDYTLHVQANPQTFTRFKDISVPLKVTGPISAPVYALDFNAMVKGKKTAQEKQQALKQELEKQITTILP